MSIDEALAALPEDTYQVLAILRRYPNVRPCEQGQAGRELNCPLARYLRTTTGRTWCVMAGPRYQECHLVEPWGHTRRSLPAHVSAVVQWLDDELYMRKCA
jgi:hypothetical protein